MDKTELQHYRARAVETENLRTRLHELEMRTVDPAGQRYSRTPTGPADADSTMDASVNSLDDLRSLYRSAIVDLTNRQLRIERAVETLDDPEERMLIRYRYLDGKDWRWIEKAMHYAERQIFRLHGEALLKLREV